MNPLSTDDVNMGRADIAETVQTADLIASWRKDFRIDVARLFEGVDQLDLRRDRASGQLHFYPAIEGDAAFYQALRQFDWYHPPTKEEFRAAANYYRPGDRVLDVGAGVGGFAGHVPQGVYCGLETDDDAVRTAKTRGLHLIKSDMSSFIASDDFQAAGLVTAFQVLEHISRPDVFMAELAALACTGGRVAVGVPDAGSYVADLPDFMLNAPPHHLTWWTEAALQAAMERAGLKVCAVHRFGVEPWERQLWWMARLARIARPENTPRFGKRQRARKVATFLGSWALQKLPIPNTARGSTLLMIGEKAG